MRVRAQVHDAASQADAHPFVGESFAELVRELSVPMGFRSACVQAARWDTAVNEAVRQLGHPLPRGPGFLYLTEGLGGHALEILDRLRAATGISQWIGSVGVGVIGCGVEIVDEPALSVMVADWSQHDYRIFSGKARAPGTSELTPAGARAAHTAIVHGDPETPDMPDLIEDMSGRLASGFMVGGLSSARGGTFQIANDVLSGGLSGMVLSSDMALTTRVTQGARALPQQHRITAAEGNQILAIDGQAALDVYRAVVGETLARDWNRAARSVPIGLPLPGSDTGDYLVRDRVAIDVRSGMLAVAAPVSAGDRLVFCRRDRASASDDMQHMLRSIPTDLPAPRGALYVSCVARGAELFGAGSIEAGWIRERFGDIALTGFFAAGEISHNHLYGYTGVLTLFY